ncbi:MAG TPA: TolC family protein, partial [Spirochaetota bacterium]|nr:TolC family protein [Spirochaetota bacterium]
MYRLYKTILPSGLLFFFSLFLSGTEVPELTLSDFITTACRKQPQFQQLLIRELEIKYQKVIDFPPGQLILSLLPEYSLKLGSTNKHTLSTTLSLARLFPVSGTEIKGIYTTSPAGGNQKSSFSIAVIQPLVHNAFGSLNRLDKKMTALEQKLVSFQILESYEDYLAVLMKLYYDWFTSHTALDQAAGAYQDNLELLKNIRAKARAGIANKADVAQTRIQVLASRENLLTASNTLQKVFNEIRSAAGKKADYQAGPVKKLPRLTKIKDTATAIEETEADSRTFKIIKLNRKTAALNAEKYQKELLPEINLEMSFIREGDDYFPKDGASEFNIGLNLNLALPDKTGRALKEQAGLRLKRTVLNNKTQIINFKNTL